MMKNQANPTNPMKLEIGDEIGFVSLAQNTDDKDRVVFFPVVEITTRDGERAYRYQYPDGQISASAIKESNLGHYSIRIHRCETIPAQSNLAICLHDRKDEFRAAMKRGIDGNFEVFAGWDRDTFFVVNKDKNSEYRVEFETIEGKTYAQCECPDFIYRKRVCKHISYTLQEQFFGINLAV